MLIVDRRLSPARLTLAELTAADRTYVSDPAAFASFVVGLRLEPWILRETGWRESGGLSANADYFSALMHAAVPRLYDVAHLESLGGQFALRIQGLGQQGDFTVTAVNRRVLTFSGLPRDQRTGRPVIDAEIRAEAFLAFCNDLLAGLAQTTLNRLAAARAPQPKTA